jgi:hypothetical protein
MKILYTSLNWIFGILFLFVGIYSLSYAPLAGLAMILASLLLLPPVRTYVHAKTNIVLSVRLRGIAIFFLFVAFGIYSGQGLDKESATNQARELEKQKQAFANMQQKNIDYFNQNSAQILAEIKNAITGRDFKKAMLLSLKYLPSKNQELIELNNEAKSAQAVIDRKAESDKLIDRLKTAPDSNIMLKRDLYQKLVNLNPENSEYSKKLSFYNSKVRKLEEMDRLAKVKAQKEDAARLAKFGNPPHRSAWDGTYRVVEDYLKQIANDPDSIKMESCTGVNYSNNGWVVDCNYRGRNAFNGLIRKSSRFTIVHDRVIYME